MMHLVLPPTKETAFMCNVGAGNSGSALSKLPSGKSSSKSTSRYDDFDLPERSNATTRAESGGGFAGQLSRICVWLCMMLHAISR